MFFFHFTTSFLPLAFLALFRVVFLTVTLAGFVGLFTGVGAVSYTHLLNPLNNALKINKTKYAVKCCALLSNRFVITGNFKNKKLNITSHIPTVSYTHLSLSSYQFPDLQLRQQYYPVPLHGSLLSVFQQM